MLEHLCFGRLVGPGGSGGEGGGRFGRPRNLDLGGWQRIHTVHDCIVDARVHEKMMVWDRRSDADQDAGPGDEGRGEGIGGEGGGRDEEAEAGHAGAGWDNG